MFFSIKCSDAAFDHPNVPSLVAQLITNPLKLVQPMEVHPDTLHKLTLPPANTQTMLPTNGLKLNFSPLMQFPPLHCLQHQWPTSGQGGYITLAAWGVPTASERGAKSEVAHKWARWLHNPCRLGGPHRFRAGGRTRSGAQKRAESLCNSCFLGDPQKGGIDMAHVGPGQKGL